MIDEKKIEEAANLHRFELIASMHGSTLGTPMQCFEEVVGIETDLIENSFITGAKWAIDEFLKDLWHFASEEPEKRNENIIVLQDEDDEDESNPLYAAIVHERHDTFPWDEYCEDNAIYKWCYFKDIAPKKGGKQ